MEGIPIVVLVGFDIHDVLADWQRRVWQLVGGFALVATLSTVVVRASILTQRQRETLRILATTDSLTGVANRKLLFEAGEREAERLSRNGGALSVMMLDIDHFKAVNDTWGHHTGDLVLQAFASTVNGRVRKYDVIGRIGGEEFVVLLPETGLEGAAAIAERIRTAVREASAATLPDGKPLSVTVSIGVAAATKGEAFQAMLERADHCLYEAKAKGRNRVVAAG